MATYFVRKTGNDASAGTSAGTAWQTIGKALGATGIASGDTVYIGSGVYREFVSVAMTSATAETKVIGDVTGEFTGDAGEVVWSGYSLGDRSVGAASSVLTLNGRDFLTFENITFIKSTASTVAGTSATSTDITLRNCVFLPGGNSNGANHITLIIGFNVSANWVIEQCYFFHGGTDISITLTTGVGADYDSNIQIRNCLFIGGIPVTVTNSGTSANEGGGVDMLNCTYIGGNPLFTTSGTRVSLTVPCTVNNCIAFCSSNTGISAGEAGAITENYNFLYAATARNNVTAGAQSVSDFSYPFTVHIGDEAKFGSPRQYGSLRKLSSLFGFGGASPPSVEMMNVTRPVGGVTKGADGTATSGGAKTMTDSGATWGTDVWLGWTVKIISGTGSGQTKSITSNTATVLTVDGNWNTQPDNTSVYEIYWGAPSSTGTATAGAASTLTDGNAAWPTNSWAGYTVEIVSGTGSGQTRTVGANTGTVLTNTATWTTNPDNTSVYRIYRGAGIDAVNTTPGCYERLNTSVQETGTVDDGASGLMIQGPGVQEFLIPVSAASTTIEVAARFNSEYTPGTKPSLQVVANGAIGVSAASDTMTSAADTWETLSVNFTPTAAGAVRIQFVSAATKPAGRAFFDTFTVT